MANALLRVISLGKMCEKRGKWVIAGKASGLENEGGSSALGWLAIGQREQVERRWGGGSTWREWWGRLCHPEEQLLQNVQKEFVEHVSNPLISGRPDNLLIVRILSLG